MLPGLDMDEKSDDSPIHSLDYNNIVNRYPCFFYRVIYLDVDLFSRSYCFNTGSRLGRIFEHHDFVPLSDPNSGIDGYFSSAYFSNSPFAIPSADGRLQWTASDDELQRGGL